MNGKDLAEILDQINPRVRERWVSGWVNRSQPAGTTDFSYEDNELQYEYFEGNFGSPAQPVPENHSVATLEQPPVLRSSMGLSAHHIYPDYFKKLTETLRHEDLAAFLDFMTAEGEKWALVEVPVEELVTQTIAYCQEIVDAIYACAETLKLDKDNCRRTVKMLNNLSRQTTASIIKGYVEGRDRLLMRSLSSNRASDDPTLSPIVKGTIMGGFGEQVRRSIDELEALHKVNSAVNSSLDLDSVLNLTVQAVAEVMTVDVCAIYVFDRENESQETMVLRAAKGMNPRAIGIERVSVGEGVTGASAKEGKPISVYDIWAEPRFRHDPNLSEESCRSVLSVPIILFTREKLVGVFNVQSRNYRNWTTEEIRFLEMVAGEIAMAIENARLYQQTDERLRQKVQELTTLQNVSNMVAATLDLHKVLDLIVVQASQLIGADMSSIYELKADSQYLTIVASHSLSEEYVNNMRVKLGQGPVGRAAELNRPVNVWDAHLELHEGEIYYYKEQYRSAMCVPLAGARGVLGVICLYTREQRHFNDEQLQIIAAFADQAAIAIENARLYEETRRGLSIKSALLQEMHHRVRNNLQTVAALLSMQMRRAKNPELSVPLAESVARIQSIAAIHDLLSREDIGVTTVEAVAKSITDIASVSLLSGEKRIRFKIDENRVPIASKEATLLAILIMELVSNAIFHGFDDRNDGEIRISAFVHEGRTQIEIRDNGKGYPPEFNLETAKTGLGMQIVRTLVTKDLQGIFRVENIGGWATATIIFSSVYGHGTEPEPGSDLIAY
jgi:two-component system, sensor histidine kinase PdtaS